MTATDTSTPSALIAAARLFARLLLHELEPELLAELRRPDVADALREVGIELPADTDLEPLRARYCELFLHPAPGAPPIASLWVDGQYEGDTAVALRKVSAAAGQEFVADAAHGAPADHLGCILLLWAACIENDAPDLGHLVVRDYLAWVDRALAAPSTDAGFYGQVCRATRALVTTLRDDAAEHG